MFVRIVHIQQTFFRDVLTFPKLILYVKIPPRKKYNEEQQMFNKLREIDKLQIC